MVRASDATETEFREIVKYLTKQEEEVIVVSYDRRILKQTGSGHFSPIGKWISDYF